MVFLHVVGSYQIYAMPVFDMIETVLVKKHRFQPTFCLRLVARSSYVAATMFVGMSFPFFDGLLGFFGGFGFAPTTYFVRQPTVFFSLSLSLFHSISLLLLLDLFDCLIFPCA
jgi:hypothetical protein